MTAPASTSVPSTWTTRRVLTANATISFVLASMINSLLHEGGHAVAGLALGLTPTISPFSVEFVEDGTDSQQIITAAAGPVLSLVLGLALMVLARRWGQGLVRLFWMWLSFMGVMNFVGYCFIAPFAHAGDTGQILSLLHAPLVVSILVGLIGAAGIISLARRFAVEVKRYAANLTEERQLAFYPWLLGTPIILALSIAELAMLRVPGADFVLILMYNVAFGIFAPMQFNFRNRVHNTREPLVLSRVSVIGLALTVAFAIFEVILAGVGGLRLS
jgi:hypothetical protein